MTDEDAPAKFETWEHEGFRYHSLGLVQLWQRGYVEEEDAYRDPPVLKIEFTRWLAEHKCEWLDWGAFGPPAIKFPDVDTVNRFEQEWHIPGEQHFADYLASPRAKALSEHNSKMLAEMAERLTAEGENTK